MLSVSRRPQSRALLSVLLLSGTILASGLLPLSALHAQEGLEEAQAAAQEAASQEASGGKDSNAAEDGAASVETPSFDANPAETPVDNDAAPEQSETEVACQALESQFRLIETEAHAGRIALEGDSTDSQRLATERQSNIMEIHARLDCNPLELARILHEGAMATAQVMQKRRDLLQPPEEKARPAVEPLKAPVAETRAPRPVLAMDEKAEEPAAKPPAAPERKPEAAAAAAKPKPQPKPAPEPAREPERRNLPDPAQIPVEVMNEPRVVKSSANVRLGPSTDYPRRGTVRKGTVVPVIGKVKGKEWYQIRLPDKTTAFIYGRLLTTQKETRSQIKAEESGMLEELTARAKSGDAEAQYGLGNFYIQKGDKQAITWWKRAAEQNHPAALYNLGVAHWRGEVAPQDQVMAIEYLRLAARLGHPGAQNMIAQITGMQNGAAPAGQ